MWVLTGDKVGTAINIGLSAGLLERKEEMDQHVIDGKEESQIKFKLDECLKWVKTVGNRINAPNFKPKKQALIVAGDTLVVIDNDKEGMLKTFQDVADLSDVVLACRVSPK